MPCRADAVRANVSGCIIRSTRCALAPTEFSFQRPSSVLVSNMTSVNVARHAQPAGCSNAQHRQRAALVRGCGPQRRAPRLLKASGGARSRRANTCTVASASPASLTGAGPPAVRNFDFLVLGSGIAGLSYALKVAEHGSVAVVTKAQAEEGCTQYAQGGVCAVLGKHDSVEAHVEDTMIAGDHLNSRRCAGLLCCFRFCICIQSVCSLCCSMFNRASFQCRVPSYAVLAGQHWLLCFG